MTLTPYFVSEWTSKTCDYCTEGSEWGTHRHALFVSREGASHRTADELVHVFMCDVLDLYEAAEREIDPQRRADVEELGNLLDARRDEVCGTAWLDPEEGDPESGDFLEPFESALSDLGLGVDWDDGYTISAVDDLDDLTGDGDVVQLHDGTSLRLRIEPDPGISINDYDCYGKTAWTRSSTYFGERGAVRPDDFDGNAEIIERDRSDVLWWQPPADVKRSDENFPKFRSHVLDLIRSGFWQVGLEELRGVDAYKRPIVTRSAWLGGVDDIGDEYVREIVSEQVHELS